MGGGIQAVVASTAMVIVFAEIIPQAVCSRFGLQIGAAMVIPVRIVIYIFFVISWPIAKLLEFLLGAHEGIVYRRAELKELVAMHSATDGHGDLQTDVVTIVGGRFLLTPRRKLHECAQLTFTMPSSHARPAGQGRPRRDDAARLGFFSPDRYEARL